MLDDGRLAAGRRSRSSGMILAACVGLAVSHYNKKPLSLKGAVVKQDSDPMKESPITDVEIMRAAAWPQAAEDPTSQVILRFPSAVE